MKKATWSFSSLRQISEICALQFYFQRIEKLPPDFTSENLIYGSSIHMAASWMYRLRKEGHRVRAEEIRDIFADTLSKMAKEVERVQYDEDSTLDTLIVEGRELVKVLVEHQQEDETILEIDFAFEVPLTNSRGETLEKPLVGELDLLVAKGHEGHLTVKDLKTSGKRYTDEKLKHDLQPTTYLYALKELHPQEDISRFEWDVLVKNKKPVIVTYPTTRNQDHFDRLFELAKTADRLIESGAFLPNRGSFFCKSCGFQKACDEWHRQTSRTTSAPH